MGLTVTRCADEDVVAVKGDRGAKLVGRCESGVVEGRQQVAADGVEQMGLTAIGCVRIVIKGADEDVVAVKGG